MAALSILLSHSSGSFIASRPPTLALALVKAHTLFPDLINLALTAKFGTRWFEVTEDAWETRALQEDLAEFAVVEKGVRGVKREREEDSIAGGTKDGSREREGAKAAGDDVKEGGSKAARRCSRSSSPNSRNSVPAQPTPSTSILPTLQSASPQAAGRAVADTEGDDLRSLPLTLEIVTPGGKTGNFKIKVSTRFDKLLRAYAKQTGREVEDFRLTHEGMCLSTDDSMWALYSHWTPEQWLEASRTVMVLEATVEQKGGKPVIYLFPPSPLPSINVSLSLVPEWTFSALYPLAPITRTKTGGSTTNWTVSAASDGTLVELSTGTSLSYLFWEAHALALPPSPPLLPTDATSLPPPTFDPSRPHLDASNAILLPFSSFIPYLDLALTKLTLHTSARNDFITYWLPSFVRIHERGEEVAMRFVEQVAYEESAKLVVEPEPEEVTRVFMLFRGVGEEESGGWGEARERLGEVDWESVVGVKEGARDAGKFRVLEWGGMEVLSR